MNRGGVLAPSGSGEIVGDSAAIRALCGQISRVAESDVPVCLLGESGTGKELAARAIHAQSGRRGAFVALNCAAIPSTLQDAELFGYERGSFTGAVRQHRGRIEEAAGGTLFLDEVGEMSPSTQALLLRTLQEHVVRRIGGLCDISVETRVLSATHRDLQAEVRAGRFRQDLYFRLMVYPLRVPPLRERLGDLPLLVEHFLRKFSRGEPVRVPRVSTGAMQALLHHDWPGNVRELENVVRWALLNCDGNELDADCLPGELRPVIAGQPPLVAPPPLPQDVLPLHEVERRAIVTALRATQGKVTEAARLLEVGRATLYRRIQQLGITLPGLVREAEAASAMHSQPGCSDKIA